MQGWICELPAPPGAGSLLVVGRLLSGVHWLTDIPGSVLLSAGLVTLYASLARFRAEEPTGPPAD